MNPIQTIRPTSHRGYSSPVAFGVSLAFRLRKIGFRMMKKNILVLCMAATLLSGCVALQQDVITLERRVDALEYRNRELQKQSENLKNEVSRDLSTLGENRDSSEKTLRGQYAGLNADMDRMQQDLRLLNGRVEEIEYALKRKLGDYESGSQKSGQRLDELNLSIEKMDQRISRMEQYLNMEAKQPGQAPATPAAASPAPAAASDQQLYTQARQAYDHGDMDKARELFKKLIKEFPKSSIVDNAQFWIGESYYREKWYEKAILEYQTVIEKYPHGNKVPAAMLKQGLALKQIGEKSSARLILQELVKKYPKASEAAIAEQKLKEF